MSAQLDEALQTAALRRSLPPPQHRRRLREAAGLTQCELSRAVEVTPSAISRWESGRRDPTGPRLARYVHALARLREAVGK